MELLGFQYIWMNYSILYVLLIILLIDMKLQVIAFSNPMKHMTFYSKQKNQRNYAMNPKMNSFEYLNVQEYPNDDFSHILGFHNPNHQLSKLQEICKIRLKDVALAKKPINTQGCGIDRSFYISEDDFYEEIREWDAIYGKPLNLTEKLVSIYPNMAIAAEFKKASPSKGNININADPVTQCLEYARASECVSVLSVLTEFKHFKGTLRDMKSVRFAVQKEFGDNKRPAILRKDFILDRYQILEARANGADTVLLIVAVLGVNQLKDLITFSRSLGMEPLVEVHTEQEMQIALEATSKVIGVNNRNLHSFQLDLQTTERAINVAKLRGFSYQISSNHSPDILIAALSGISTSSDLETFKHLGVACSLIGETLMKSSNPKETILQLLNINSNSNRVIVKLCGYRNLNDAKYALQQGAGLIGTIFAEESKRKCSIEEATAIVNEARLYGERNGRLSFEELDVFKQQQSSKEWYNSCAKLLQKYLVRKPLVVGVFQDQSVEYINRIVRETGIDLVQLHGNEDPSIVDQLVVPCLKVLHVPVTISTLEDVISNIQSQMLLWSHKAIAIILDSTIPSSISQQQRGGTGKEFNWDIVNELQDYGSVFLAGGLTSESVSIAIRKSGVIGVDVSSGIEISPGVKDTNLVKQFIENTR